MRTTRDKIIRERQLMYGVNADWSAEDGRTLNSIYTALQVLGLVPKHGEQQQKSESRFTNWHRTFKASDGISNMMINIMRKEDGHVSIVLDSDREHGPEHINCSAPVAMEIMRGLRALLGDRP